MRGDSELGRATKEFTTWSDALAYVEKHGWLYYLGGLAYHAHFSKARVLSDGEQIMVAPADKNADAFIIGPDRLSQLRQPA